MDFVGRGANELEAFVRESNRIERIYYQTLAASSGRDAVVARDDS